jgi:hypothetical protein
MRFLTFESIITDKYERETNLDATIFCWLKDEEREKAEVYGGNFQNVAVRMSNTGKAP